MYLCNDPTIIHQILFSFRRKKKCIRFLSDNEDGDDYAPSPDSPCGPPSPGSIDHCPLSSRQDSCCSGGDEIKKEVHSDMGVVGVTLQSSGHGHGHLHGLEKQESPPSVSSSPPPPPSILNSPQKSGGCLGGGSVVSSQTACDWSTTRSAVADSTLCESPKSPTQSHQALSSGPVSSVTGATTTADLLGCGHGMVGATSSGGSGSGGGQETDSGVEDVMCSSV